MSRILIIEDEIAIADLERDYLELSDFEVEVEHDGTAGLELALNEEWDLIVLDLMLPGTDGFEICQRVRSVKNVPIIMVSARKEDIDKVRDLRIYDHLKYLISGDFTLEAEKIRDEIRKSALASFIRKAYNTSVSVRVHIHEKGDRSLKQAKRFTGELIRMSGGDLVNEAPYDAELHFYKKKSGGYVLFLKPLAEDQRFAYDCNRLSTSMQPVKAAVMNALISDHLSSYARVIDLFAGNGSLLLERDEALRTKAMFACDTNEAAVGAGRKNSELKGRTVNYVHRSAFTFDTQEPFDEIISELPDLFEKTDRDRTEFFEKLAKTTVSVLRSGGKAFYLTAEGNEMKAMVRKEGRIEF